MYGDSCTIRIEKLANGFTVRMTDPEIVKKNRERESKRKPDAPYPPWRDPEVSMAFEDAKSVIEFLKNNLDKVMPSGDDYETSFVKAIKEDD